MSEKFDFAVARVAPNWRHPYVAALHALRYARLTRFVHVPADIIGLIKPYLNRDESQCLDDLRRERLSLLSFLPRDIYDCVLQLVLGPHPHLGCMPRRYPRNTSKYEYHHHGEHCIEIRRYTSLHTCIRIFNYHLWYSNGVMVLFARYTFYGHVQYMGGLYFDVWHLPAGVRKYYTLTPRPDPVEVCIGKETGLNIQYPAGHHVAHYPLECQWSIRRSSEFIPHTGCSTVRYLLYHFGSDVAVPIRTEPFLHMLFEKPGWQLF